MDGGRCESQAREGGVSRTPRMLAIKDDLSSRTRSCLKRGMEIQGEESYGLASGVNSGGKNDRGTGCTRRRSKLNTSSGGWWNYEIGGTPNTTPHRALRFLLPSGIVTHRSLGVDVSTADDFRSFQRFVGFSALAKRHDSGHFCNE